MKNLKLSQLDVNQIKTRTFDEENDAERVVLIGQNLSLDTDKLVNAIKEGIQNIKIVTPIVTPEIKQLEPIEKHIFIPQLEIKTIEIPIIVKEIEYREIEKQVIIPRIEYITIEKPVYIETIKEIEKQVIVKELEIKEILVEKHYPMILKVAAVCQVLLMFGILLINLLKR